MKSDFDCRFSAMTDLSEALLAPMEIFLSWLLSLVIEITKVDRIVYFRYSNKEESWILISEKNLFGARSIPGKYRFSDMPDRKEFGEELDQWYYFPSKNISFDAVFVFRSAFGDVYALAIDDTKSARSFTIDEQVVLRKVSDMFVRLTFVKNKITQYERESATDFLTGLPNGRSLEESRKNISSGCTLARVDVDEFKKINDSFGHRTGDEVLKSLADIFKKSGAEFFRIGGDEFFGIIPENVDPRETLEKILSEFRSANICPVPVTFSAGFCFLPGNGDFDLASDAADQAAYFQKKRGRNGVRSAKLPDSPVDIAGKTDQELTVLFGIE